MERKAVADLDHNPPAYHLPCGWDLRQEPPRLLIYWDEASQTLYLSPEYLELHVWATPCYGIQSW
jgi:hypothetical protein